MTTTAVREKPIPFSGEMVRAILDGRKTQTRRVVKLPCPSDVYLGETAGLHVWRASGTWGGQLASPYAVGDRLWVRETFVIDDYRYDRGPLPKERPADLDDDAIYFRADGRCCDQFEQCPCGEGIAIGWRPPMFMPRWASRITLEVTGVRVERVQDIGALDVLEEGTPDEYWPKHSGTMVTSAGAETRDDWIDGRESSAAYAALWDSINADRKGGIYAWVRNPWVWVYEFRRVLP